MLSLQKEGKNKTWLMLIQMVHSKQYPNAKKPQINRRSKIGSFKIAEYLMVTKNIYTSGKRVGVKSATGVRIPLSPQRTTEKQALTITTSYIPFCKYR